MWRKKEHKFKLCLMLIAMSCLNCCARVSCDTQFMPIFPKGGKAVAEELQTLGSEDYPHLWEWLARLNKLRLELETNKNLEQ